MKVTSGVVWDQHCCLPLLPGADIAPLHRYLEAGATYVSVNVGYAPHGIESTVEVLSSFRHQVLADPEHFRLATSVEDILSAREDGRLAVGFDLEDTNPLGGRIEMVQTYYDLGVRSMLMTYNGVNQAGYGCHADVDEGLTPFGRRVVKEMNRVGMFVDGSHTGYRTCMEAFSLSDQPVIFSHSSMRGVWDHERNIRDDQARACAESGGVIGINGVGIFLGENDASAQALARHVDYAAQLVGPEHVGIGTDYVFDSADLNLELSQNPHLFPPSYSRWGRVDFLGPELLGEVQAELRQLGYEDADVAGVMGGNFLRLAEQVWKSPSFDNLLRSQEEGAHRK